MPNSKFKLYCTRTFCCMNELQYSQFFFRTVDEQLTKGTSQIKLYKELGLESLRFSKWFRWLCTSFKIK